MKKELEHFHIGSSYGGNQDWFRTFMMRIGGCGAETACDSSLYFAIHKSVPKIYPFDIDRISREDYVEFAHMMEEYLWPRMSGIYKLSTYAEGYSKYLRDRGVTSIEMDLLEGSAPYEAAADAVKKQIDSGYPIPTLILNHKARRLRDYVWHWFLINGYDEREDTLMVKAVTYSGYEWLDLKMIWDSGHKTKGGLILYKHTISVAEMGAADKEIISVAEMRAADKHTIEKGTPSKELMRRAAQGIYDAAAPIWTDKKTLVVCGSGNNGGDGYALAEILKGQGCDVTLMRTSEKFSEDGEYYYNRCKDMGVAEAGAVAVSADAPDAAEAGAAMKGAVAVGADDPDAAEAGAAGTELAEKGDASCDFAAYDIIVDCMLGTGFSGAPREDIAAVIEKINEAGKKGAYVISADINSGMNGDTGEAETAVKSDLTVSIGYYKHGLFLGRADELIGELVNVDIGIELAAD